MLSAQTIERTDFQFYTYGNPFAKRKRYKANCHNSVLQKGNLIAVAICG